jgi:2,3-dihydroxybenzoate decarboxylase
LLRYYFTHNVHITTSGNFSTNALLNCMAEIGADRIMYSIDYPYEHMEEAAEWWDGVPISPSDKLKISRQNAIKLFKLPLAMEVPENDKPYFKGGGVGPVDDWRV